MNSAVILYLHRVVAEYGNDDTLLFVSCLNVIATSLPGGHWRRA